MEPIRKLLKATWSLILLLLLSAIAFNVLAAQVHRYSGMETVIGLSILGYVLWRILTAAQRVRRLLPPRTSDRPELPPRAKWVSPRSARRGGRRW